MHGGALAEKRQVKAAAVPGKYATAQPDTVETVMHQDVDDRRLVARGELGWLVIPGRAGGDDAASGGPQGGAVEPVLAFAGQVRGDLVLVFEVLRRAELREQRQQFGLGTGAGFQVNE